MEVKRAEVNNIRDVIYFFNRHLTSENDGVTSPEFFCPLGINAATKKGEVLIVLNNNRIVGAMRYYKRKTKDCISLYQFAIDPIYRGKGVLKALLLSLGAVSIEYVCPIESEFNHYFLKTGWTILESNNKYNRWMLNTSLV